MQFTWERSICLLLFCINLVGCRGGGDGYRPRAKVYKVTGKITYLGSPLIGAAVSFSPVGDQPAAVAKTNDSGQFSLMTYSPGDGAAAGEYKVVVVVVDSGAEAETPQKAHYADGKVPNTHAAIMTKGKSGGNVLPAKYGDLKQTPLKATVDPNNLKPIEFDLK